jgi:hypothetical protein
MVVGLFYAVTTATIAVVKILLPALVLFMIIGYFAK